MAINIGTLITGNMAIGSSGGGSSSGHADTWVKYTGDTEWTPVSIQGSIAGSWDNDVEDYIPTTQIPNVTDVVALEIGTDVTSIGSYGFYYCSGLTSVTIPDGLTSIGDRAFLACSGLTSVTFEGKDRATVQGMENYPFGLNYASINGVTIHCTDDDILVPCDI